MDRTTFIPSRARRTLGALLTVVVLALGAAAPAARAAALNPPPPDFERCQGQGQQTVCHGGRVEAGAIEPTGIICGTGSTAFEIVDASGFVRQDATRWYDADGNLVRRTSHEVWFDSAWTNPGAGTSVRYRQAVTYDDRLAMPGDFASVTETTTGVINFIVPGSGAIVRNAGRTVIDSDGSIEFRSGPQAILDYFLDGETEALQPICDALAG